MIIISTRKNFTDPDKGIEDYAIREYALIEDGKHELTNELSKNDFYNKVTGNKVLILMHGYNNDFEDALCTYKQIEKKIADNDINYDHVIGFIWQGNDKPYEFLKAKHSVKKVAHELHKVLDKLISMHKQVDIMAHSLGNSVVFHAAKNKFTDGVVNNFYSIAAAVDNDSMNPEGKFHNVLSHIENIFVFHSKYDIALRSSYKIGDKLRDSYDIDSDIALGLKLPEDLEFFETKVNNVHFINCSNIVGNGNRNKHSKFKNSNAFFQFIKNKISDNSDNIFQNHYTI